MDDFNVNGKRPKDDKNSTVVTGKKEKKVIKTNLHAIMEHAREIWGRDKNIGRSSRTEDRDFREMFGCGPQVVFNLWQLMSFHQTLPISGQLNHLLWTLMFLKIYGKEATLCTLAGAVDKKTFRKWIWGFLIAIGDLEEYVVSPIL